MLRIRKSRNFSFLSIAIVSVVGVISGIYIYQPLLAKYAKEEKQKDAEVRKSKKIQIFI
jgi:preprotein translocase subunit SecF